MKKKKLLIVFVLFGVVGFMVGRTVLKSVKTDNDSISKIQNILEDHCNCESIEKNMYAKGVQYSSDQGFTTEKIDFTLTNCEYDNLNEEGITLVKLFNAAGLETFNMITLDFISQEKQETVIIKNGKIQ